jgi:hypothetical protein
MTLILLLLALVLTTAVVAVLHEVVSDDPRSSGYTPPRSHPLDAFERTGSTYR